MKTFIGFVICAAAMGAGVSEARASEALEVISCPINKNHAIQVSLERDSGTLVRMKVEEKYFFDPEGHAIVTLERGSRSSVVDYGTVIMMTQDFGRSGYAFVRFERRSEDEYRGWFDFDLFLNPTSIRTDGNLLQLDCRRIR